MQFIKIAPNTFISSDYEKEINKPIAVVCGFMDGSAKNVMKYAEIYDRLGFVVLVLLSKSSDIAIFPIWFVHRTAARRVKNVFSPTRTVVGHLMSNGGIRSLHALDYHLGGITLSGMVLDSCPTVPSKVVNPEALRAIFFPTVQPKWLKEVAISLLITSLRTLSYFRWLMPSGFALDKQLVYITTRYPLAPRLFLYSDADNAINSESVEQAIKLTKSGISANVDSYNFKDSPHVQHYLKYKKVYTSRIASFYGKLIKGLLLKGKI